MSKILYILPYLSIGGTEKHVLDLISGFEADHELFLLAPPGETRDEFNAHQLTYFSFTRLDQKLLTGLYEFYSQLSTLLKKNQVDMIHIHGAPELILLVKPFSRKIPILFTVHGFHGPRKIWDYRFCAWICNRFVKQVIAVAHAEKELLLKQGLKPQLIQTIHNGVPDPRYLSLKSSQIMPNLADKLKIGAVARLEETKGIDYLIEAYSQLTEKFPQTHLCIVGMGSQERKLQELTKRLNLNGRVTFTGYKRNVHDYLHLFDIFVIPSLHEAHPLVLMEGMGHGKPIIATNVGGIPEVIKNKWNGLLVPAANSSVLREAIEELLNNQELREQMSQNARQTYEERFTVKRMISATEKIYHSVQTESTY